VRTLTPAHILYGLLVLCPATPVEDLRETAVAIAAEASTYGADPFIYEGLIKEESNCKKRAHNKRSRCKGLMQVSRGWARGRDLFHIRTNVAAGAEVFAIALRKCGDVAGALSIYNGRRGADGKLSCKSSAFSRRVMFYAAVAMSAG
jgi:soluble lytic murein transglycosylase-like protein